ncbi:60S ribosomal protein L4-B [Mycena venus]|uniref:60S ribosomal protein L4-B n=1 Tax=Mycena venus TaxID=2733690 RepID=A0A8H7D020_9AGAR|nr:60S ribosomal protein L4-B [Mycena venus]
MCRGGRMFAPTETWHKWHVKVSQNQCRFAVVSALAASALPSLVLMRSHRIEQIEVVPLVIANAAESFIKTKEAAALLKSLNANADVVKVSNSRKLHAGKGKMRNHRHRQRLLRSKISKLDVTYLSNSDEIQSVVCPAARNSRRQNKNPLINKVVLFRLNPHAKTIRRHGICKPERLKNAKKPKQPSAAGEAFTANLFTP